MQLEKTEREQTSTRAGRFTAKIGSTAYRVTMYFPAKETETLEAKIFRLARNDLIFQPAPYTMEPLQTGRPPDGGLS